MVVGSSDLNFFILLIFLPSAFAFDILVIYVVQFFMDVMELTRQHGVLSPDPRIFFF